LRPSKAAATAPSTAASVVGSAATAAACHKACLPPTTYYAVPTPPRAGTVTTTVALPAAITGTATTGAASPGARISFAFKAAAPCTSAAHQRLPPLVGGARRFWHIVDFHRGVDCRLLLGGGNCAPSSTLLPSPSDCCRCRRPVCQDNDVPASGHVFIKYSLLDGLETHVAFAMYRVSRNLFALIPPVDAWKHLIRRHILLSL
jgi:hypothetical protein